jgi:hypothetical protein
MNNAPTPASSQQPPQPSKTPKTSKTPPAPGRRRRVFAIAAACVVALVLCIVVIAAVRGEAVPRLNENAVVLTKFITSGRFEQLPFEQQRQFYKVLDDRDAELDQAYTGKRLTESEYRDGLEAAWLGKHINRVEKYFGLPPGQARTTYLGKLVDKKERKKAKSAGSKSPEDIDADETAAELKVEKWPEPIRTQWKNFHDAYRAHKKAVEKAAKPQTKPST